jgi:raffinose/stachyose/melibiose transport system permease protein
MSRRQSSLGTGLTRTFQYAVLGLALFAALAPVLWAVASSFKSSESVLTDAFSLPTPPRLDGYRDATQQVDLTKYIANTLLYACASAVLCPTVALLLAYPCARMKFRFRKALTVLITTGIAIPGICLITPEFYIMLRAGLLDTKVGMIIFYVGILLPLAFVILRAFLLAIPREVEEAAMLDGASYLRMVTRIIAPLAAPALATVAIIVFITVWNDFLWNLLLAPGFDNRNTQVALTSFRGQFQFNVSALLAGSTIVLAVPVLLFLLTQRLAIAGLTGASLKAGPAPRQPSAE